MSEYVPTLPDDSGKVVGIRYYAEDLIVACENGVYIVQQKCDGRRIVVKCEPLVLRSSLLRRIGP